MCCDECGLRNLRSVNLSSMVNAVIRDERICVQRDSTPDSAVVVLGIRVHLSSSSATRRGCSSRMVEANGAHSSNPAFSFENR